MLDLRDIPRVVVGGGSVFTIGVFDGVHLGHRHLLDSLRAEARRRELASGVITFSNHPRTVLVPGAIHTYIIPLQERIDRLREAGVDHVIPLAFTRELSELTYRQFVDLLVDRLGLKGLVVGPDFAIGHARKGTAEAVAALGEQMGFTVSVVEPLVLDGEVVSTTAVRACLGAGDVRRAAAMLARPYSLGGEVVHGEKRGRALGFPTANIAVPTDISLPLDGIYGTVAWVAGNPMDSVTSIGVRPTFDGTRRTVETFIMDFAGDLYGTHLRIDLLERIREEKRFASVEDLIVQMRLDVLSARQILGKRGH